MSRTITAKQPFVMRAVCVPGEPRIPAAVLRLFEIAFVLVPFDHVASLIVNANNSMM